MENQNEVMVENRDEVLVALLNKIASILDGSEQTEQKSTDNYIAWCKPGMPFQAEDLQFAIKGITSDNPDTKKAADETRALIRNAAEFSRLANSIPSSNVIKSGSFETKGDMVWSVYDNVLKNSQVADTELTDEEKERIKEFRDLLVVTKEEINLVTKEKKLKQEDGPIVQAYNLKMGIYNDAVREYNTKRLSALNGDDRASVQDFTLNANLYRSAVKSALNAWVANGYKVEVEEISAYIKQVSEKNLTLLKADLQDKLESSLLTDPLVGAFHYSSFYPGTFVNNNKGWTKITFDSTNINTYSKQTHSSTSASVGLSWGLWSAGGSGNSTKSTNTQKIDATNFKMEFSIAQVVIGRSWMSPEFLTSHAWQWKKGLGQEPLSDGENRPKGQMIAFPTGAVFVKDIKITSDNMNDFKESIDTSVSGGGSAGWGPFKIGASHSNSSSEKTTNYNFKGNTLTIEGMQLIAFKCFALPLSPDPSDEITKWV